MEREKGERKVNRLRSSFNKQGAKKKVKRFKLKRKKNRQIAMVTRRGKIGVQSMPNS